MDIDDRETLGRELDRLLDSVGGSDSAENALADIREAHEAIRADNREHGGPLNQLFFDVTVGLGAAVFAIYGRELELFVLPCSVPEESALISAISPLAMFDVEGLRDLLARRYGRAEADITLTSALTTTILSEGKGSSDVRGH